MVSQHRESNIKFVSYFALFFLINKIDTGEKMRAVSQMTKVLLSDLGITCPGSCGWKLSLQGEGAHHTRGEDDEECLFPLS